MITVLTQANAHLYGPALPSMYRLRQRSFIARQGWDIPSYHGMEYDAYDNPATTYLVYRGENGEALGVSRLYPTDRPYMLSDVWPDIVDKRPLPSSPKVWEGTRFAIEKDHPGILRTRIKHEIVCAYLEFCLAHDIEKIIGVMPPAIWRDVFASCGWLPLPLGPTHKLEDGSRIYAAELLVSESALLAVQTKTGLQHSVLLDPYLYMHPIPERKAA